MIKKILIIALSCTLIFLMLCCRCAEIKGKEIIARNVRSAYMYKKALQRERERESE